jgi:DNA-binding YbaB/EbfC family protein
VTMRGLGDLMKQAQEMQSRLADAQTEIAAMEVIGESGAGLVKVTMNGRYEVKRVTIDPFVMSEQTEVLEDLLAAACNDTVRKVEKAQSDKMGALTGGLNLPFGNLNS